MNRNDPYQDILAKVLKPARYINNETNSRHKDFNDARVRFVLAFPDVYEVGFSHLGLRILYYLLNDMDGVMADRVYAPWPDFEQILRHSNQLLRGIESREPLNRFDFVGISLQYELSYTNVLTLLELGGLSLYSWQRNRNEPWVVGGGPCAYNPEPLADVFDFIVIGEAEEVLSEIIQIFEKWRNGKGQRRDFLEEIRHVEGIYVPSFFRIRYSKPGKIEALEPLFDDYRKITKRLVANLEESSPLPKRPLVPLAQVVHNRLEIEISRGCTRGCRFCQAGYIYRPVRERYPLEILRSTLQALKNTGYEELSLLSLSTGDYSQIQELMKALMDRLSPNNIAVSLPSMRVGTLSSELMEMIKGVRKTGFTLAPEAGSERLRRIINKNIDDTDLLESARNAFQLGWRLLKLYFMIGLPTETKQDLDAIIELCFRVWKIAKPFKATINVSISTFVPKPMTAFQWIGQIPRNEIESRLQYLKQNLGQPGIRLKWQDPGQSFLEAVLARGDRRLLPVIEKVWRKGARFDAWTEEFNLRLWEDTFKELDIDPFFYAQRVFGPEEILPWEHLSAGVTKEFLWDEYQKGLSKHLTPDCRSGKCSGCGVCNHRTIAPVIHRQTIEIPRSREIPEQKKRAFYKLHFAKLAQARFLSQLELAQCLERAFRRTVLPVAYTRGYHPHIRISFQEALPVGMESEVEEAVVELTEEIEPKTVKDELNQQLPPGILIRRVERVKKRQSVTGERVVSYLILNIPPRMLPTIVENHLNLANQYITKKTKSGEVCAKLKEVVVDLNICGSSSLVIKLLEKDNVKFRPQAVLEFILGSLYQELVGCRIIKTAVDYVKKDVL